MRIVHIAPNSPYNNYWGYQDNLLPKYQRKMGHDVTVIITNTEHKNGKIIEIPPSTYDLEDGEHIYRLPRKIYPHIVLTNLKSYIKVYDLLVRINPDFIFFHGLISSSIFDAIKYKKINPKCVIVQDNHMDYNIGYPSDGIKNKMFRMYYRIINRKSIRYVDKVYGVTPWRKKYAEDYFGIPTEKTDVLIMGADDEKIDFPNRDSIRADIRKKYGVLDDDFLIVTGGKIDSKKKIDVLMEACATEENVKLLIFGNVADDVKLKFENLLQDNDNLIYIGWIPSDKVYSYFFAADLVFFPGQHSVLWEQACAAKVPCVFEKWEGMDHVNNGGNSDFISPVNIETLSKKIEELCFTERYYQMKRVAESEATDVYLYSKIAEKSLECVEQC